MGINIHRIPTVNVCSFEVSACNFYECLVERRRVHAFWSRPGPWTLVLRGPTSILFIRKLENAHPSSGMHGSRRLEIIVTVLNQHMSTETDRAVYTQETHVHVVCHWLMSLLNFSTTLGQLWNVYRYIALDKLPCTERANHDKDAVRESNHNELKLPQWLLVVSSGQTARH